ncbi:hypothetical protein MMPV_006377 [Pyropia vietnamensis]
MPPPTGGRILVCIKRVIDAYVKPRIHPSGSGVDTGATKMAMNPFCEIALEEALRLRDAGTAGASEVVAVTVGDKAAADTLRTALAMGADRGIHVVAEGGGESPGSGGGGGGVGPNPLGVAKLLRRLVEREGEGVRLVMMGKQAIDGDCNQTGQMLAGMLNWPQATFASEVKVTDDTATVTREVDGGLRTLGLPLPAIITADLRLNTPRFATLPNIMKAKRKKVDTLTPADLGLGGATDLAGGVELLSVAEPPKRVGGGVSASVEEMLDRMKAGGVAL